MYLHKDIFGADMLYYTFDDFMTRREHIKSEYALKEREYKILYNMYVESRPWMAEKYRHLIWDYLNDYLEELTLLDKYNEYLIKRGGKRE